MSYLEQIILHEQRLLIAFQNKDIVALEEALHDDCLFVLPNGTTATKENVLDNYRKGETVMTSIRATDMIFHVIDNTVVVSMQLELKGKYKDQLIDQRFRYLRVWKLFHDQWKVISTCGVPL